MARYSLFTKPSAVKEIEAIDNVRDRRRVVRRIQTLGDEPRPRVCEILSAENRYRVRQGVYRIPYYIEDERLVVSVVKVAHRKDAYRT